jgi:hypothetical protein
MALGSTQPLVKISTRDILGCKGGRCVRLTTSPSSCAECHEIWEPKPLGTLWATQGQLRDSFTFIYFLSGTTAPSGQGRPQCRGFTITPRHTTLGRTPLDEWSVRRRDLYLITHSTHNRQISMLPVGFEPAIPENERPSSLALDRAATGVGHCT